MGGKQKGGITKAQGGKVIAESKAIERLGEILIKGLLGLGASRLKGDIDETHFR